MNPLGIPFKRPGRWTGALAALLFSMMAASAELPRGPAVQARYEPRCANDVCEAWLDFRSKRPFPVQTIAGRTLGDKLVLIFSEPALPRAELGRVLRRAFGSDVLTLASYRWRIGMDGWLDDVVLTVKWNGREPAEDLLRQPELRDRLSVVAQQLWGTAYGLNIEATDANFEARARTAAPNLDPRPHEVQAWLQDPVQRWRALNAEGPVASLPVLQAGGGGGYASVSGRLNLLVVPAHAITLAHADPAEFARRWRAVFRQFAVASDVVVGASWSGPNALLIVARQRQVPLDLLPPLRFETFALLADADARQLSQSYERTTPFAGKLREGAYQNADWAPIYLSDALIDTEFGALLNITDQMLKSWSSAGNIEYLYFDYPLRPRPGQFAFGAEPIDAIVRRETGSLQVLFNWNTSGATSISDFAGARVMVPATTGALPVTYGAELTRGEGVVTGKNTTLLKHENTAYRFFAGLRDPNLARVVSYTVLYQALTAYKAERGVAANDGRATVASLPNKPGVAARQAATQVLVDELAVVLDELAKPDAKRRLTDELVRSTQERLQAKGEWAPEDGPKLLTWARERVETRVGDTPERLQRLRASHAALRDAKALARLMVDRDETSRLWRSLQARDAEYTQEVKRFNEAVRARTLTVAVGKPWQERLVVQEKQIARESTELSAMQTEVSRVRERMDDVLGLSRSIETVRSRYVAAAQAEPEGWIRTPSMVLSWDTQTLLAVGGHNLNASALRIEIDPRAEAAFIENTASGKVLRVPPSQAESARANAALLARRIEHEGLDVAAVRSLLNDTARAEVRPMPTALQLEAGRPATVNPARYAGREALSDSALRSQMVASFEDYGRPSMMVTRDADGYFIVATREGQRADCCLRVLDFATLRDTVVARQSGGAGEVMLVNFNERQANALRLNLKGRDDQVMLEAVGGSGGGRLPPDGTVHVLNGEGPEPAGPGGNPGAPRNAGRSGGPDEPGGPGPFADANPGDRGPYLVGVLPERGAPLEALVAAQKPRRVPTVEARLEGEAAVQELARLQEQAVGPLAQRRLSWNTAKQGEPVVFKLSWPGPDGVRPELRSSLIAGVDPRQKALGSGAVADAINTARAELPAPTTTQFQARVKELIDKHRDRKWVLDLVAWTDLARVSYLLSQAEPSEP